MSTMLIDYDLIAPNKDYDELIEAIKSFNSWCRVNASTWMIKTNETSTSKVRDFLKSRMDSNDRLIVIDVTSDAAAWVNLPQDVSDWIKQNL